MTRVLVVGGGVAGLLTTQLLLDRADDLGRELHVTLLVLRPGHLTASRSGGLAMRYASTDPRSPGWSVRSAEVAAGLARRHEHVRPHLRTAHPVVVSRTGPVAGVPGRAVDPATLGLTAHGWGVEHERSPQWDPCGLLPGWPRALAADPRVRVVALDRPVRGLVGDGGLSALHDDHGAEVTVACLGLGAHALGDREVRGRLGVLVTGPLPSGTVHARGAVVDDDDELRPRYTVPHAPGPDGAGTGGHLHVGGTYLPVDDPACWDDPALLAAVAEAEVPALLADARRLFPDLAGWQPVGPPWWGLRPVRGTVALGHVDPALVGGRDVVVSHGWGGSGWTIGPAVAEETARAVLPGDDDPLAGYGWWRP